MPASWHALYCGSDSFSAGMGIYVSLKKIPKALHFWWRGGGIWKGGMRCCLPRGVPRNPLKERKAGSGHGRQEHLSQGNGSGWRLGRVVAGVTVRNEKECILMKTWQKETGISCLPSREPSLSSACSKTLPKTSLTLKKKKVLYLALICIRHVTQKL